MPTNTSIWESTERQRTAKLPENIRIIAGGLARAIQPVKDSLETFASVTDMADQAPEKFNIIALEDAYRKMYENTATEFAIRSYDEIIQKWGGEEYVRKQDDILEDIWKENIRRYIETGEIADRIIGVANTTKDRVRSIIQKGIDQGLSIPDIAKNIDKLGLDNVIRNRSVVIARTETVNASNFGTMQGARATNLKLDKIWISTLDQRTRIDHLDADNQTVENERAFRVGGEDLDYPGDPSGSAWNVCNCRCAVAHQRRE